MSEAAAQELARQGLPVFPCKRDDKAPHIERGFHGASTNPNHIGNWWWQWPDALIGVPCKRFSVLDLDLQHQEARDWFADNKDKLLPTRTHHTRSGGRHLLFRPGLRQTNGLLAKHVDTRGEGKGYIIWWPAEGLPVEHAEIDPPAEAPAWLVQALAPAPRNRVHGHVSKATPGSHSPLRAILDRAKIKDIVRYAAATPEGWRDRNTFWAACRLVEMAAAGALDLNEAEQLIIAAAVENGLGEGVGAKKFQSALREQSKPYDR